MKKGQTIVALISTLIIPVAFTSCVSTSERYGNYIDGEYKCGPFYLNRAYSEEKIKQKIETSTDDGEIARRLRQVEMGFYVRN